MTCAQLLLPPLKRTPTGLVPLEEHEMRAIQTSIDDFEERRRNEPPLAEGELTPQEKIDELFRKNKEMDKDGHLEEWEFRIYSRLLAQVHAQREPCMPRSAAEGKASCLPRPPANGMVVCSISHRYPHIRKFEKKRWVPFEERYRDHIGEVQVSFECRTATSESLRSCTLWITRPLTRACLTC